MLNKYQTFEIQKKIFEFVIGVLDIRFQSLKLLPLYISVLNYKIQITLKKVVLLFPITLATKAKIQNTFSESNQKTNYLAAVF